MVGIGASAGGLAALTSFLKNLPARTGIAFILAQHRSPLAKDDILIPLLKSHAAVNVVKIHDGMRIEPDRLLVPPAGRLMGVFNGRIQLFKEEPSQRERLPIDFFFRSLAEDLKEQAGAVVLSGADTDGTLGAKAVKGLGGLVIVQDPANAEFNVMPASAAQAGVADFILPPEKMPAQIIQYMKRAATTSRRGAAQGEETPQSDLEKVLLILRTNTGNDFSPYKHKTVNRRIKRRMDLQQIRRLPDYAKFLKENPKEVQELFRDLLIGVSTFFRDAEAFQAFKQELVNYIRAQPAVKKLLRFWVPGCSSGEEAYSLAMLAKEALLETGREFAIQIYATDLDGHSIEGARQGTYPLNIASDVPEERLSRFFSRTDAGYKIRSEIREMIVFSVQNVLQDPPFSRLDVICCRNLLIYLKMPAQKRVLALFHYALVEGGLLFLGTSESLGNLTDLFHEQDKKWRIYLRKVSHVSHGLYSRSTPFAFSRADTADQAGNDVEPGQAPAPNPRIIAERFILEKCTPAAVLATQSGEILYIHGRTGKYLELAPGKPAANIFTMAREGIKADLTAAVGLAASTKKDVSLRHLAVKIDGGIQHAQLTVHFVTTAPNGQSLLLVSFADVDKPRCRKKAELTEGGGQKSRYVQELELELQAMRENLRTVSEEYATTTEELKSMNEELQSSNEELQSTNEEVETAKEEMQSINEEQVTLNSELQSKIDELSHVNNDMSNLLSGTDIATLFLDADLNIKRFTPATQRILNLIHSDVGRPVSHIATNLNYVSMVDDARQVLETLRSKEFEVWAKDGAWYQMRILPYRTVDNVIEGLVLTFNDITKLKMTEKRGAQALGLLGGIMNVMQTPLLVLDGILRVTMANHAYCMGFQTTPREIVGQFLFEVGNGIWDVPDLREALKNARQGRPVTENVVVEHDVAGFGTGALRVDVRLIAVEGEESANILLTFAKEGSG
ncbi:CheR family methyltransferase [Solidesulfovibrio sp.]|uniref:CheR family methyltransferase n=1 Tax=Solidesulfovibrio sp. TaxID=2910990 RepID=UPI00262B448A|nr:CheR family methyltransferase [Solidesulfovibrio sp.]